MRGILSVVLLGTYIIAVNLMFVRASRFSKDQSRVLFAHEAWRPSSYTEEGRPYWRAAVRFAWMGLVVVVVTAWLLNR